MSVCENGLGLPSYSVLDRWESSPFGVMDVEPVDEHV